MKRSLFYETSGTKCKFWGEITGSGPWVLKRRLYCYRVLSLRVVWFDWLRSKRADYFAPINYATIHARDCTDLSVGCWSDTHRLRLENQLRSQPENFFGGSQNVLLQASGSIFVWEAAFWSTKWLDIQKIWGSRPPGYANGISDFCLMPGLNHVQVTKYLNDAKAGRV